MQLLQKKGYYKLPVLANGHLVGILSYTWIGKKAGQVIGKI